jgi:outer membrane protein insertion porin family
VTGAHDQVVARRGIAAHRARNGAVVHQAARRHSVHRETLDQALKDLQASDLFVQYQIEGVETGDIVLKVRENPIINRVILEGNKALKSDKITTRKSSSRRVRSSPAPRSGRTSAGSSNCIAARVDSPRSVEPEDGQPRPEPRRRGVRDQRRAEVQGPPDQHHRQRKIQRRQAARQMATKQARWFRLLSSNTL